MGKNNLEKLDRSKHTISMKDFVVKYLNDGVEIDCYALKHRHLRSFGNPYVLSVSFEFASSNIELILSHKILLVSDRYGSVVPYINPKELKRIQNLDCIDQQIMRLKKVRINQLSKLISLWSEMQILLYERKQIEGTIELLEEINKHSKVEQLGGKSYVKEYQRR